MSFRLAGAMTRRGRSAQGDRCPIDRAMQVVGTRSAILLMREAYFGTTRFDDFAARTGLTEAVTAARLRDLVDAGLLVREPYQEPGQRTRFAYILTESGSDLLPAVLGLAQWGAKHTASKSARTMRHAECGERIHVAIQCGQGHDCAMDEVVVS